MAANQSIAAKGRSYNAHRNAQSQSVDCRESKIGEGMPRPYSDSTII